MTRQQRLCNNKWFRLATSVILTFAVLLVFVFSPFAEAHAVGVLGTELIDIIIAGLSACGVTFTTSGGFGGLEDYVSNLIDEYAVDQNTTALGLLNGVQYGNNKLGQLLFNNRLVRFISAFVTWVKAKFTLINNDTTTIVPAGTSLNGYTTYALPLEFVDQRNGYYYRLEFSHESGNYEPVCMILDSDDNYDFRFIAEGPGTILVTRWSSSNGNTSTRSQNLAQTNGTTLYWTTGFYAPSKSTTNIGGRETVPRSMWDSIMSSATVIESSDVAIGVNTGVINPPLDDDNYEDGDGALVDVGSTWGATLEDILDKIRLNWQNVQAGNQDISMDYAPEKEVGEQLPEQTDIENLPGGTAWNPTDQQLKFFEFESIWHYVAQWIQDFTAGASVVWNAAVQLPSPMVNMVYAMVTLAIIFGVIKVMRA